MESVDWLMKAVGTAPYFSTLVSLVAWPWVKLPPGPVISPEPVVIGLVTCGAETTLPSRTMANWSRTDVAWPVWELKYRDTIWLVIWPKAFEPLPSRLKLTTHWLCEFSTAATL